MRRRAEGEPSPGPFRLGLTEALGAPALAMGATFLAFGAAVAEAGLSLGWALLCSGAVYGMAGQLVLLGVAAGPAGAALPAAIAATAANARFLPMSVAIAPLLGPGRGRVLALPFIAITPWAAGMRFLPTLPGADRLPWFLGFALASWLAGLVATAVGHGLAPVLPASLRAALLFANPLYFALLLAADLDRPAVRASVIGGAVAAPLALWLGPAWGLLAAGGLGGTAAFLWTRRQ